MGGLKACKRVSWASDDKISQVRLYNPKSCPLQCGTNPQTRSFKFKNLNHVASRNDMSPGFKKSQIPLIQWRCPPKFEVNDKWMVASGQESKEIEVQNDRMRREAEAFYPRSLVVPPNPLLEIDTDLSSISDENETLVISLIPIEERVPAIQDQGGSLIDLNLLRKFLSNPKMIEELLILQNTSIPIPIPIDGGLHHTSSSPCLHNVGGYSIPSAPVVKEVESSLPSGNCIDSIIVSTEKGAMPLITSEEEAVVEKYLLRNYGGSISTGEYAQNALQFQETKLVIASAGENGSSVPSSMPNVVTSAPKGSVYSTMTTMRTTVPNPTGPIKTAESAQSGIPFQETKSVIHSGTENGSLVPGSRPSAATGYVYSTKTTTTTTTMPIPNPNSVPSHNSFFVQQDAEKKQDVSSSRKRKVNKECKKRKKSKQKQVCYYFNTREGCRRGEKCVFFHDDDDDKKIEGKKRKKQQKNVNLLKKMKLDGANNQIVPSKIVVPM